MSDFCGYIFIYISLYFLVISGYFFVTLKSIKNGASFTPFFTNIKTMTKNE